MAKPSKSPIADLQSSRKVSPLVELWLLRLLVPLGGHQEFINERGFRNERLAEALGLSEWVEPVSGEFDLNAARSALRKLHKTAEHNLRNATTPQCLSDNVARLSNLVGMSDTDCRILELGVLLHTEQLLDVAGDFIERLSDTKLTQVLAVLLALPEREIQLALSGTGLLAKSGLVVIDRGSRLSLSSKIDLLSPSFAHQFIQADADPINLLRETVALGSPAHLDASNFEHIAPSLALLLPYFRQSIATGRRGVNVFLHGRPGTGKSQLAKVLARELESEHFEVASEDSDGDPISGAKRLRAFRAAQSFFAQRKTILLFDEAEDVFNDGGGLFGRKSTAQTHKAWINRMLEDNPVPTVWLSNSVSCMDPAFIRRFDMVIELPVPPKRQRERIIQESCAGLLDAPALARVAESEDLSPAIVTKAASVVALIRGEIGDVDAVQALELLISNTLEAQGHRPLQKGSANRLPDLYDPAFIHADSDLAQVAAGLIQSKAGRLCLYGPPGTGKTAYGRWLAEQMGVPLLVKRASDLMSKWVGENEKNIARAFKQAEQDGALLLVDEVDSFLRDRRDAKSSWEASLVNEMLTQMESFSGVFIASTNLMDGLDQAALRRFDLKVKFDFLKPTQACDLMDRYCIALAIPAPVSEHTARVTRLSNLTPGDFAAVARQHRFRPITSTTEMVAALEAECSVKEGARSSQVAMGFLQ